MKKILTIVLLAGAIALLPTQLSAQVCTTIKDGVLTYPADPDWLNHYLVGQVVRTGFDAFGYNYQAHLFNGSYFNVVAMHSGWPPYEGDDAAYLAINPAAAEHWAWLYRTTNLTMKWNDAWLSNKDCDGDGYLDRHFGFGSYIGSGAWVTNHQSDVSAGAHWTYFVKIVALPADAPTPCDPWTDPFHTYAWGFDQTMCKAADGTDIGPGIWTDFAAIQEVYNDPAFEVHGILYKSPTSPGWGAYKP